MEARPIDRNSDPDGEILDEHELVGTVGRPRRGPRQHQCAERSPPAPDRHTDDRYGVARELDLLFLIEILAVAERGDHEVSPGLHYRSHRAVGLAPRYRLLRFRAGNRHPCQLAVLFDRVDGAPVAEILNGPLGHTLDGCFEIGRGGKDLPGVAKEIEPLLPDDVHGGRRALGTA